MGGGCSHEHLAARGRSTSRIGPFGAGPRPAANRERFRWFQSLGNKLHGDGRASPGVRGRRVCKGLRIRRLLQMASRMLAAKPSAGVALPPEQDRVSRWALPSPRGVRCRQVEWSRSPTGDGNDPVLYHCSTQLGRIGEIGSTEPWLHHGTGRLGCSREHRRARVHRVRRGRPSRTPDRARGRPDSKARPPPRRGRNGLAFFFAQYSPFP